MLSLFILTAALFFQATPAQRTITLTTLDGHDRVTFDPVRTPESEVRRWIRFSPHVVNSNGYLIPESLGLCVVSDREYLDCGTRDWRAKNFVFNANVNLRRIRDRIKTLDEMSYPPELKAVVSYLKQIQETDLYFQSQLLAFIQSGQTSTLSGSFGGIDPASHCSAEIAKVAGLADKALAYRAGSDWFKCVNRTLRNKIGPYPVSAWNSFLMQHGIKEHVILDPVD